MRMSPARFSVRLLGLSMLGGYRTLGLPGREARRAADLP